MRMENEEKIKTNKNFNIKSFALIFSANFVKVFQYSRS